MCISAFSATQHISDGLHFLLRYGFADEEGVGHHPCLSEPPGLSLGLEEGEDVSLPDGALDVADDGSVLLAKELHLDLCALALGASAAEHLGDASQGHLLVHSERVRGEL